MGNPGSKILPLFVYPVGLTIVAGFVALGFSLFGSVRTSRVIMALAIVLLWIAATPLFADWLTSNLEARHPPVAIESLPRADVAIVLGGSMGAPAAPGHAPGTSDAVDRVIHAARLFRTRTVGAILVSGGNLPWVAAAKPEAEYVGEFLVELGVPRQAIVLESKSRNTRENAVNSASLVHAHGWQSVLLVTSGFHMPRALASFRQAGIQATPASTDIRSSGPGIQTPLDLLPNADALQSTSLALKEHFGMVVYRLRGWM